MERGRIRLSPSGPPKRPQAAATLGGALTGLGLGIANGGSGCPMCRAGDRPSPHFDHGRLHLDNYRGGFGVYDSVMHVLIDVIVGQSLYGEVPFLRNSPGS